MTPVAIIQGAAGDGVTLVLTPSSAIKASGDQAAVNRWLEAIREHKAAIVAALKVSPADTARGWLLRYQDGTTVEVYIILADGSLPTRAVVLRDYPSAIEAAPIEI